MTILLWIGGIWFIHALGYEAGKREVREDIKNEKKYPPYYGPE